MKTLLIVLIHPFLFISIIYSLTATSNSSDSLREAKFALPPKDTTGYPLTFIGGIGLTTGQGYYSDWSEKFKIGPAIDLGIEIPFTNAHKFSLELIEHFWIASIYLKGEIEQYEDFVKISKNTYGEGGLSIALKYYFGKKTSKFRASIHLGKLVCGFKGNYSSFEFGYGLNYRISDNLDINLTRKHFLHIYIDSAPEDNTPSLLFLNLHYKLVLKRGKS